MKKKLFMLLALVMTAMTASAVAGYDLKVGTNEHGTITFTVGGETREYAVENETVTVTITPDDGYVVNQPSGTWYAAAAEARTRAAAIELLKDIELTAAGENTWTFEMKRANVEISATYKKLLTNQDITVDDIQPLTYNAEAQEPTVTVQDGTTTLVLDTDYSVEYSDNTNAGTATVTITALATSENYAGETTTTFTILKADITPTAPTARELTYNAQAQALVNAGSAEGGEMQYSLDGQTWSTDVPTATNADTYTVYYKVVADANHNDVAAQSFTVTISPAALTAVTLEQTEFMYNIFEPVAQTAAVSEVKAGALVVPAAQYDVEGNTQTEPGTYTVTVTGKTNFTGSVTAQFVITNQVVDGEAEETETGEKVDDVKLTLSVVDRTEQTLQIDEFTEGTATAGEDITVEIPAQINGWSVVSIAAGATDGLTNVTDIVMPDTEKPIIVGANAFPGTATIHTTLALLDDYALMASLKDNYEAAKVVTTVTPANKYWTLGTGCDVIIPEGVEVYSVQPNTETQVCLTLIPEELLTYHSERIIKANNGVLLLGEARQSYDLIAYGGRIASGTPIATDDNKEYDTNNMLEPVVEKMHYEADDSYFVMSNNEFHAIKAEDDEVKVPAGKAVLHLTSGQAGAKAAVLKIAGETTGISQIDNGHFTIDNSVYDLSGRHVLNAEKGLYIVNGKKVVVK